MNLDDGRDDRQGGLDPGLRRSYLRGYAGDTQRSLKNQRRDEGCCLRHRLYLARVQSIWVLGLTRGGLTAPRQMANDEHANTVFTRYRYFTEAGAMSERAVPWRKSVSYRCFRLFPSEGRTGAREKR